MVGFSTQQKTQSLRNKTMLRCFITRLSSTVFLYKLPGIKKIEIRNSKYRDRKAHNTRNETSKEKTGENDIVVKAHARGIV